MTRVLPPGRFVGAAALSALLAAAPAAAEDVFPFPVHERTLENGMRMVAVPLYRPDNVIALVVGDIRPERAFDVVARQFGGWIPGYQAPAVLEEPLQQERRTAHLDWPNPTRPYLMLGYHAPAFSARTVDVPTLDVISELLFSDAADREIVKIPLNPASVRVVPIEQTFTGGWRSAAEKK